MIGKEIILKETRNCEIEKEIIIGNPTQTEPSVRIVPNKQRTSKNSRRNWEDEHTNLTWKNPSKEDKKPRAKIILL